MYLQPLQKLLPPPTNNRAMIQPKTDEKSIPPLLLPQSEQLPGMTNNPYTTMQVANDRNAKLKAPPNIPGGSNPKPKGKGKFEVSLWGPF
jgi:hypothetical protein